MNSVRFSNNVLWVFQFLICFAIVGCGKNNQSSSHSDPNAFLIVPMERVGLIKAGMTLDEVEKVMGPSKDPTFGSGKQRREYPKLGLTIKLVSDGSRKVESVQCGSLDPNDNLVKSNKHQTEEKLGIGSSRDKVIETYGQPSRIKDDWAGTSPEEALYYDSLGIRFFITSGKVHQIIVIF
jgi:hypothetical protein